MCRSLLSVDWQGYVYDCDFNQMLGLPLRVDGQAAHAPRRPDRRRPRRQPDRRRATTATAAPPARARAAAARSAPDADPEPGMTDDPAGAQLPGPLPLRAARVRPRARRSRPRRSTSSAAFYGNVARARRDCRAGRARSRRRPTLVFNGDFHWFDVDAGGFARDQSQACSRHAALRGNVETELAGEDIAARAAAAAIPAVVGDAEVARSNEILERLRETARGHARACATRLGGAADASASRAWAARAIAHRARRRDSLAGWGFAQEPWPSPRNAALSKLVRRGAASTCSRAATPACRSQRSTLPRRTPADRANNGAAGMPNFADSASA